MSVVEKAVEHLAVGNRIDLLSCPFLKNHAMAKEEYGIVVHVDHETPECVVVGYEGIDQVGYPAGTILQVRAPRDVPDPDIQVRPVEMGGEWATWKISKNLTDRWGDLNNHDAENKPLDLLEDDDALFERLRDQRWGEITFVARKDGQFGILFEVEFCSQESEAHMQDNDPESYAEYKPHAEVVQALLNGMTPLQAQFPGVQFAVPDESQVIDDRPAAWAFVPDGLLTDEQREALGFALLDL